MTHYIYIEFDIQTPSQNILSIAPGGQRIPNRSSYINEQTKEEHFSTIDEVEP